MALYLITYDLKRPGQSYEALWATLRGWGAKRGLESVWFLRGTYGVPAMRDALKAYAIDDNDRIFVGEISDWSTWNAMIKINELT